MRRDLTEVEIKELQAEAAILSRRGQDLLAKLVGEVKRYRDLEASRMYFAEIEGAY